MSTWNVIITGIVAAGVLLWLVIAGAKEKAEERPEEERIGKDTVSGRNASSGNPRGVREGDRK